MKNLNCSEVMSAFEDLSENILRGVEQGDKRSFVRMQEDLEDLLDFISLNNYSGNDRYIGQIIRENVVDLQNASWKNDKRAFDNAMYRINAILGKELISAFLHTNVCDLR